VALKPSERGYAAALASVIAGRGYRIGDTISDAARHAARSASAEHARGFGRYLALINDKPPSAASMAIAPSEMARNRSGRSSFRCKVSKHPR